jgi:hypothetical protein
MMDFLSLVGNICSTVWRLGQIEGGWKFVMSREPLKYMWVRAQQVHSDVEKDENLDDWRTRLVHRTSAW